MSNTNTSIPNYELQNKTDLVSVKETNKVVLSLLFLTSGLVLTLLISLVLVVSNYNLAKKEKIYVEQLDGQTRVAQEQDYDYRSDEVLRETVSNWLYLNWEWDSRIPHSDELDPGFRMPDGSKVPSRVYAASYLLDEGFRPEFLNRMSELIPNAVYSGNLTSNLKIYHLGKPIRLEKKDEYQILVVASRTDISSSGEQAQTKFNKLLTLKTIEPYRLILGEEEPSAFRKQLNQLLQSGLVIKSINNP